MVTTHRPVSGSAYHPPSSLSPSVDVREEIVIQIILYYNTISIIVSCAPTKYPHWNDENPVNQNGTLPGPVGMTGYCWKWRAIEVFERKVKVIRAEPIDLATPSRRPLNCFVSALFFTVFLSLPFLSHRPSIPLSRSLCVVLAGFMCYSTRFL